MFSIVVRSVKYIDIYVEKTSIMQSISIDQSQKIKKQEDEYSLDFFLVNKGNIDEKVNVKTTISNIF